ncbi:MAG: 50S ribosomal protein L9 [Synergistaceae bacterium]|jgi:large subunit ribosomal protein L9|nr:50S ribosomal protein L9 [Synergistaceae bacterium]
MKVILLQDVSKLGKKGDLIEVNDGYGRNFLLPRGLAEEATSGKVKVWKEAQSSKEARKEKARLQAEETKRHLQGRQVTVKVSAGEGGKLFGSVTSIQIAEALIAQLETRIDKKEIRLDEAIRQVGSFPFKVRLAPSIEAEMTVKVEAE